MGRDKIDMLMKYNNLLTKKKRKILIKHYKVLMVENSFLNQQKHKEEAHYFQLY